MRRVSWWLCGVLCAMTTVTGMAWGAPEPTGRLPEGRLWTERPVLPWDAQTVGKGEWAKLLNTKFDTSRRGRAGEVRRYRIQRENVMYDRVGRPANRMVAEASVERRLLRKAAGEWAERITWTSFKAQQTMTPDQRPAPQEVVGAAGISYEFSPSHFDYVNIPADFSAITDPMSAYLVKVVAMDLSGFDALAQVLRTSVGNRVAIGTTQLEPRWQQGTEISQAVEKEKAGQYQLGDMLASVAGVTRRGGEPCLLIWFGVEGSDVSHDFSAGPTSIKFHGTEYFWGELALSLRDGHVVGGELRGPMPWVMQMGVGGAAPTEMPIAGVIGQVSLWEVRGENRESKIENR